MRSFTDESFIFCRTVSSSTSTGWTKRLERWIICAVHEEAETEVMTDDCKDVFFGCFHTQGSYGVVRLAYNKDSEQYYVSGSSRVVHLYYLFISSQFGPSFAFSHSFRRWRSFQRRSWWGSVDFCVSEKTFKCLNEFLSFMCCLCWYDICAVCVCVCWWFQAVCLLKDQTGMDRRIRSLKPRCLWRKCTRRSPSWRNWTIIMLLN